MRYLLIAFLLISLAGISYFNKADQELFWKTDHVNDPQLYQNGILRKEYGKVQAVSNYKIDVELLPNLKQISAVEVLTWINRTSFSTGEVQLHLYPNAFKNSNTLFLSEKETELKAESKTEFVFSEVSINGIPAELQYFQPDVPNKYDSTVARILLPEQVNPGDSVSIVFKYRMQVPRSISRLGYAAGRNFYFLAQWFPKAGVFENGRWVCSQYHPYTNFYSDFGNYNVTITVPQNYAVASTGVESGRKKNANSISYRFAQAGVHDFAWMATDDVLLKEDTYYRKDKTPVEIRTYIQRENEKYATRYINAIKNSLEFFEDNIGVYPYQTISLIDVPKTSRSVGMEYPTMITVGSELFSPIETISPEYMTIHEVAHQFFYGMVANNGVYETWLNEGPASYITSKIINKYYNKALINFKLFGYYPIFGLNFLSYNELPLVYSLGEYQRPEGALLLPEYYNSPSCAAIADTSYKLPDVTSHIIAAYVKPELMLIALDRYLGYEKVIKIFRDYFTAYKFSHTAGTEFIRTVQNNSEGNMDWFFNNLYRSSAAFDYKIRYVKTTGRAGEYEVFAERLYDGVFRQDVALYTDKDTLYQKWSGEERWKRFLFRTRNKVLGAELDPFRKNIMDLNYANNSYTVNEQYGGSINLSLRWLFWIQNLILIISSIA